MSVEKQTLLRMLEQAYDAEWADHQVIDAEEQRELDAFLSGRRSALESACSAVGATEEEIKAANLHRTCPVHSAHACDSCKFACARCWQTYDGWKARNEVLARLKG